MDSSGLQVICPVFLSFGQVVYVVDTFDSLDDMEERSDGSVDAIRVPYGTRLHYIVVEPDEDDLPLQVGVLNQRQIVV